MIQKSLVEKLGESIMKLLKFDKIYEMKEIMISHYIIYIYIFSQSLILIDLLNLLC